MKLIQKFKNTPWDLVNKLDPKWKSDLEKVIGDKIDSAVEQLKEEAEYEGQPELFDDKFLYERFKENVESGMYYGNWQILKYFYHKMKIKIFEFMRGNWLFTEIDKEMYTYFLDLKVNDSIKCKNSILKIKSSTEINENDLMTCGTDNDRFKIYYEFKTDSSKSFIDYLEVRYFFYFYNMFWSLKDIIANSKMQQKTAKYNLLQDNDILTPMNFFGYENREITNISLVKPDTKKNPDNKTIDPNAAYKAFESYLNEDKEYQDLLNKLNERTRKLLIEFKSTDIFKNMSDSEKSLLEKMSRSI